jgi:hypothetical protein
MKNSVGGVETQIHPLLVSALDNVRGHLHALAALVWGKERRYLPKWMVFGSQSRSGLCGEREKSFALVENRNTISWLTYS